MNETKIRALWSQLYGDETRSLKELLDHLRSCQTRAQRNAERPFPTAGLVYCAYPDAFDSGLAGLQAQLPRLASLGVTILWILPLLVSPGRDQGFDISDYSQVDPRYGGNAALAALLKGATKHGISLVFDVAVNHTSDQHPWFVAAQDPASAFRDYYHWSHTGTEYAGVPLIFPDFVQSNWTWHEEAKAWNFHRFYPFQPDLNYRNPPVTLAMIRTLADWRAFGISGFRMDAAALLWKEEGTLCDSLPQTHVILKLFRACLDFVAADTLLLAEANVPSSGLKDYFAQGDECRAAYHFELMPKLYQALLHQDPSALAATPFPELPEGCSWITFLRLHDEVTLDLVPPADRGELVRAYAKGPETLFRGGEAFSGRLFDLLDRDPNRTLAAWSLLFSLPGTPLIYYGDEIGMGNNHGFFEEKATATGFRDSRFLHRGPWNAETEALSRDSTTAEGQLRSGLEHMLRMRRAHPALLATLPQLTVVGTTLISVREASGQSLTIETDLWNFRHEWILV